MLSTRPIHINVQNAEVRVAAKAPALGSKTPGRALVKSRSVLRENAVGPHTIQRHGLGNKRTPFHAKTQQHSNKPLIDKTPLRNRQDPLSTPAPQALKIAKVALDDNLGHLNTTVYTLLRPSSTRKSLRSRTSGDGSAEKALGPLTFQTPVNQGHHWDVSDISIEVPNEVELNEQAAEEDLDEIEYMPPKMTDSYIPPFDFAIPDYKEVGKSLRSLAQSYKFNDENDLFHATDVHPSEECMKDLDSARIPSFKLPNLVDEDPFSINKLHSINLPTSSKVRIGSAATLAASRPKSVIPQSSRTMRSISSRLPSTANSIPKAGTASRLDANARFVSSSARTKSKSVTDIRHGSRAPVKSLAKNKNNDAVLTFDVGGEVEDFRFDA